MSELNYSYLLARADRIVKARLDEAIDQHEITLIEFTALWVIARRPGLSNARLARRALVTPQAMHRVVSSLESAGYVVRTPSPAGGRALGVTITSSGEEVMASVAEIVHAQETSLLDSLDPADREVFLRVLTTLAGIDA